MKCFSATLRPSSLHTDCAAVTFWLLCFGVTQESTLLKRAMMTKTRSLFNWGTEIKRPISGEAVAQRFFVKEGPTLMKYREKKSTDLCIEEYFVMWPFRASLERPDSDLYGICACRGRASQWYGPSLLRPRFLLKKCDDGVTHFLRPASAQLLQPAEVGSNWVHDICMQKRVLLKSLWMTTSNVQIWHFDYTNVTFCR